MEKQSLLSLFSSNPDKYYKVSLFDEKGFKRQNCKLCGKFFWSISNEESCPEHENYNFIGDPPTSKRLDFVNTWKELSSFFRKNDHEVIQRYPVVCRWREDLYYTIASIVDFQRVMNGKIVFEIPKNPLVVPQMCLRFNDIENVGFTGRHYTSFCMVGQTCNANAPGGYWKDKCIELDHALLNEVLGIPSEEITFVEDVWMGAGAFGYSLEYYVRGLELGNAVFTEFEGNEYNYRTLDNKIIDMGAGLERLSWITMGSPTSYDTTFGPVIKELINITGVDIESRSEILSQYFRVFSEKYSNYQNDVRLLKTNIAKELELTYESLEKVIAPFETLSIIADHTRTLLFAISDGSLPSNVGGGYNLRIILRRTLALLARFGWNINLEDIIDLHIDHLKSMYPELKEHKNDVRTIIQIESDRYSSSKERMLSIANSMLTSKKSLKVEDLIRLYESDGITPDFLLETGVIEKIPSDFYLKLAELHTSHESKQVPVFDSVTGLKATKLLYYEDESIREFDARVLRIVNGKYMILDQTAFYPRGGGQEPDFGDIEGIKVTNVIKQNDIVLHKMEIPSLGSFPKEKIVHGIVNDTRRRSITKNHSATHILNSAARNNLGSWVWQNSAFKEEHYARLDITHHSALTREEINQIEKSANEVVQKNLPVLINKFERSDAEERYTFRIYQGGAVPSNNVRIVNIDGWDVEACGGTHVNKTGEIGLIKILKTERIQDGVVRLEFVAGNNALQYIQYQEHQLSHIAQYLGSSREKLIESFDKITLDNELTKRKFRNIVRKFSDNNVPIVSEKATISKSGIKIYGTYDDEIGDDYHIALGEKSIDNDPHLVYVALVQDQDSIKVIVFVGAESRKIIKASKIAKSISLQLGGTGGGGTDKFGQGGGRDKSKVQECLTNLENLLISILNSSEKNG
ncbi:MAG: alanine--tRNA ligase [Thaumarchaeota archaeon]|nr:MAG: alanine--tRNA ligase [Nitrososphaerota archaeon]